jgi:hypothetical protein
MVRGGWGLGAGIRCACEYFHVVAYLRDANPSFGETRLRDFGRGGGLDFLFHNSLILRGAIFASLVLTRCCEIGVVHEGLNIGN